MGFELWGLRFAVRGTWVRAWGLEFWAWQLGFGGTPRGRAAWCPPRPCDQKGRLRSCTPVVPSFRALSGRLKCTVRRHTFNRDSPPCSGHSAAKCLPLPDYRERLETLGSFLRRELTYDISPKSPVISPPLEHPTLCGGGGEMDVVVGRWYIHKRFARINCNWAEVRYPQPSWRTWGGPGG